MNIWSEDMADWMIRFIHVPLGGIALIAGAAALMVKKGSYAHIRLGRIFYFSMLGSAASSVVIAVLPDHESPFLLSVGLFSSYFLLSGRRSLSYREEHPVKKADKVLSSAILVVGLLMIFFPIYWNGSLNIVLVVFGLTACIFGWRDLHLFRNPDELRPKWLKLHLGKMTGGYISAVSAFFVVNDILPGLWNWFAPGIVGGLYISYEIRKLSA